MEVNAYALYGKEDLRLLQQHTPVLEDGSVLLKVNDCGICGSDLRMFYNGPSPRYRLPTVLGHEIAGTIIETAPGVTDLHAGDLVTVAPLIPCMQCEYCLAGQDNLCENGQVIGVTTPGGMSETMVIPGNMVRAGGLVKVPAGVAPGVAALTENVACCLHGLRQAAFQPGQSVLIIGAGPVGLAHLQLLRRLGAGPIVISGRNQTRLKLAAELGADEVLDANTTDLEKYPFDRRFRPHMAIIAAAVVPETRSALQILRPGGSLLLFSGYPSGTEMLLNLYKLHYSEKHIHASIDCTLQDFHDAAALLPELQMERLITHRFPLEKTLQAFRAAKGPEAVKTMIEND